MREPGAAAARPIRGPYGLNDLLPVGQQAPPLKLLVVSLRNLPEHSTDPIELQQFVLDHVDVRTEVLDRLEQPAEAPQL